MSYTRSSLLRPPTLAVLSVAQLHGEVARVIEGSLKRSFVVHGAITACRAIASGHWVLTVNQVTGGKADPKHTITCWFFRSSLTAWLNKIKAYRPNLKPSDLVGQQLNMMGRINYYATNGTVNLLLSGLDLTSSSLLADERAQVLEKLKAEGLVARAKSKIWPRHVNRLAFITARQSAAERDVLETLANRGGGMKVDVFYAPMQGGEAAGEILRLLTRIKPEKYDALLISRGGGSKQDLSTFDSEPLARALATFPLPLMTALGHSTDMELLANEVANRTPITPTEGAVMLTESWVRLRERGSTVRERAFEALKLKLSRQASALRREARSKVERRFALMHQRLKALAAKIQLADPSRPLAGGLAMIEQNGRQVTSAAALDLSQSFEIIFADGTIKIGEAHAL